MRGDRGFGGGVDQFVQRRQSGRPRHGADAIAAVAVGGTPFTGGRATVVGSLLGALLIQLLRYTLLANGVPDAAALVVKGAIIAGRRGPGSGARRRERAAGALEPAARSRISAWATQQRVLIALFLLILFGALRYDHFLGASMS